MHISQARLVVVDVETTGLSPKDSRIIEIAAVAVSDGTTQGTFQSLIDPQCPLPRQIQRLTGIRPSDLDYAPVAADVIPEFLEFLGDSVFVAHNVTFDWQMVHGELQRLGLPDLTNPKLCTVRLARRLLRELPSKSLGSLIRFYGLSSSGLHRALKDARMTAAILERLLKRLQSTYDICDIAGVLHFQSQPYAKLQRQNQHLARIKSDVLPRVPASPGIYTLLDSSGRILYVGRSKNLQQRVRSYFAGIEGHPAHTRKLVRATRDIDWQTTDTELEAVLLESREIKAHKPRFNRAAIDYRHRPSLRLGYIKNAPWVTVVHYVRNDGATYFGPFGSRREAETIAAILVRIYGASPSSFQPAERLAGVGLTAARIGGRIVNEEIEQVRAFLAGDYSRVLEKLDLRMRLASAKQKYELALQYRDWHAFVEALPPAMDFSGRSILKRHGAAVLPNENGWELHLFAFGCPVKTLVLPRNTALPRSTVDELIQVLAASRERLSVQHITEMALFAQWLRQVDGRVRLVWLTGLEQVRDFERDIREHLKSKPPHDQTNGQAKGTIARFEA